MKNLSGEQARPGEEEGEEDKIGLGAGLRLINGRWQGKSLTSYRLSHFA